MQKDSNGRIPLPTAQFRAAKHMCRRGDGAKSSPDAAQFVQRTVTIPYTALPKHPARIPALPFSAMPTHAVSGQTEVQGDAQVTSVSDILSVTNEMSDVSSGIIAGASLHAPDSLLARKRKRRKNRNRKGHRFSLRMPEEMWRRLRDKTDALESYPSSYALELIAADLCLPADDYRATRNKYLKKAFADLRVAFDDCGVNINQIAKATNSGQPCPLTRPEIDKALADFARGCRMLESLRP